MRSYNSDALPENVTFFLTIVISSAKELFLRRSFLWRQKYLIGRFNMFQSTPTETSENEEKECLPLLRFGELKFPLCRAFATYTPMNAIRINATRELKETKIPRAYADRDWLMYYW